MSGLQEGKPFSEVVGKAKELGYTEPDPRDDLGGVDVARKALSEWPRRFETTRNRSNRLESVRDGENMA